MSEMVDIVVTLPNGQPLNITCPADEVDSVRELWEGDRLTRLQWWHDFQVIWVLIACEIVEPHGPDAIWLLPPMRSRP